MKISFITPYFSPARAYGGPIASSGAMCRALVAQGVEVRVVTSDADGSGRISGGATWIEVWPGVRVHYSKRFLLELWSPGQAWHAVRGLLWANGVYVWGAFFWALPLLCWINLVIGRPLIVSPRGMLFDEALASKGIKKRLYLAMVAPFGHPLFHFHATSQAEAETLQMRWHNAKIAIIPNGVEMPEPPVGPWPESGTEPDYPYLLYMGRLHPTKKLEGIIGAFAEAVGGEKTAGSSRHTIEGKATAHGQPWTLIIAGDGEVSYRLELERLAAAVGVGERVRFVGHVAGAEKARLLAAAGFAVQAPNPENFGNVVSEALAHGTPALVGKGLPWEALDREGCGFWVNDSEAALAEGMRRMMSLTPEQRKEMGAKGRAWMARDFSWGSVAEQVMGLFEELAQQKKRRSAVGG
jgi:glycosyltransferase involved in cell wall biosynthesis